MIRVVVEEIVGDVLLHEHARDARGGRGRPARPPPPPSSRKAEGEKGSPPSSVANFGRKLFFIGKIWSETLFKGGFCHRPLKNVPLLRTTINSYTFAIRHYDIYNNIISSKHVIMDQNTLSPKQPRLAQNLPAECRLQRLLARGVQA